MKTYYFLGIGGIGMSAIARYMKDMGNKVYGYDRISTPLTIELEKEGMVIVYNDDISTIPSDIDMIIYTPAVSHDNKIYKHFVENNYKMEKNNYAAKCIIILFFYFFSNENDSQLEFPKNGISKKWEKEKIGNFQKLEKGKFGN